MDLQEELLALISQVKTYILQEDPTVVYSPKITEKVQPQAPPLFPPPTIQAPEEPLPKKDEPGVGDLLKQLFPHMTFIDEIPSDEEVRSTPSVIILSFEESPAEKELLSKLAAALNKESISAHVKCASQIRGWDNFFQQSGVKLILASTHGVASNPKIVAHLKESALDPIHRLGKIPYLPLADISLYIKQPKLKVSLWKQLMQHLK